MDSGASKASTVWRQVATVVWRQVATAGNTNHLLRPVAIRCQVVTIGCQAVDSGASKASTVWRQVATVVWATGGYGRAGGYVPHEFAEGVISFNPQPTARELQ